MINDMKPILLYGDTVRSPTMRREVPHTVADPFLYAEVGGKRFTVLRSLEVARMKEVPNMEPVPFEELGLDELVAEGRSGEDVTLELALRACRRFGIEQATVPFDFPTALADYLRNGGITIDVDSSVFADRRRAKSPEQLAGMRRAQRAAAAATAAVAAQLRQATIEGNAVMLDGEPLTSERLKAHVAEAFAANGATADEFIVAHGKQTCIGHHMGSGAILAGEPITVDLWPCDRESSCYTDMTRTFVVGEQSDELLDYHRLCKIALDRSIAAIRPGARCSDVHRIACEVFEEGGYPTQLSKQPGEVLLEGFFHSLGHGVGLEVHESPHLDQAGDVLVEGDAVAVEPGCYRQGYGGVRLEDLVLVTADGAENLTDYPYELAP
jgi:Xaa-Pro aminopeptidase